MRFRIDRLVAVLAIVVGELSMEAVAWSNPHHGYVVFENGSRA